MEPAMPVNDASATGDAVALRSLIREELDQGLRGFRSELLDALRLLLHDTEETLQASLVNKQEVSCDEPFPPSAPYVETQVLRSAALTDPSSGPLLPGIVPDGDVQRESSEEMNGSPTAGGRSSCFNKEKKPIGENSATKKDLVTAPSTAEVGPCGQKKKRQKQATLFQTKDTEIPLSKLKRFTTHRAYEVCSGALIASNSIFLGWTTQHMAVMCMEDSAAGIPLGKFPEEFRMIQILFLAAFTVELGLRWVAEGFCEFFRSSEVWWNILDVVVVGGGILEIMLDIYAQITNTEKSDALQNVSVIRVLRVVRIVRVARVIRVMKFFRELRMMIFFYSGFCEESVLGHGCARHDFLHVWRCLYICFNRLLRDPRDVAGSRPC
jgi:hypothetical protein